MIVMLTAYALASGLELVYLRSKKRKVRTYLMVYTLMGVSLALNAAQLLFPNLFNVTLWLAALFGNQPG